MLFNYPKNEIDKFKDEAFESGMGASAEGMSMLRNNLSISMANNIKIVDRQKTETFDSHHFGSLNNLISRTIESDNKIKTNKHTSEINILSNNKLETKIRRNSMVQTDRILAYKAPPTSFHNKIILWTEQIYSKFGSDGRLTYLGFKSWVEGHPRFLKNFSKYFRPQLWLYHNDEKNTKSYLSYQRINPALNSNVSISTEGKKKQVNSLISLYGEFLLFFAENADFPFRIIILKDLQITFEDEVQEISIANKSGKYKKVTILNFKDDSYKKWKKVLENYSR